MGSERPLLDAIAAGNLAGVTAALAGGADASARRFYRTATDRDVAEGSEPVLLWAVRGGQEAIVAALLAGGADVDARDDLSGRTALVEAAARGNRAMVQRLLQAGADPTVRDARANLDPLAAALVGGHRDVVADLAAGGARVDRQALLMACLRGDLGQLARCLDLGAEPRRMRVLADAARTGRVDVVQWLLDHGADLAAEGSAALCESVNASMVDVASLLLECGVSPASATCYGWPALHLAAYQASPEMVALLLRHGADRAAVDREGHDACHWARVAGKVANVALLAG